ncbi:hypothetical protein COTS27_01339 [Spirochaetota bacterium]|nr:hypothetical protein COTS27_01339 [Spirochaetota bacterium]
MNHLKERPLVVQSNFKVLLYTSSPYFEEVRDQLSYFLELQKSPNVFYTYALNEISLWNGFSHGWTAQRIKALFTKFSRYGVSEKVIEFIEKQYYYQNMFSIIKYTSEELELIAREKKAFANLDLHRKTLHYLRQDETSGRYFIPMHARGIFKSEMIHLGYPVNDQVGFEDGQPLEINYNHSQYPLRGYQDQAVKSFVNKTKDAIIAGAGIILLPCGSGKTIVGIAIMAELGMSTLIITPNVISLRQWRKEIIEKTNIRDEEIGEYSGEVKEIRSITLTTYQILTTRREREAEFHHLNLFNRKSWGFIVYDEIHMLPAKVFRFITSVQAKRRLGLTATLVREDGREKEVFSLIGPKKFDYSWKELEKLNFIARVKCFEVKVTMPPDLENNYFSFQYATNKFRMASENPYKFVITQKLVKLFSRFQILIIGQYLTQLEEISKMLKAPLLVGKTNYTTRQRIYQEFNDKKIRVLVVSKIANFAVDLPNAEVAIQLSGTFGSRQEEAQRLGRIIRPKSGVANNAYFFTLTTLYSREEFLAQNRKGFLMAQGYTYTNLLEFDLSKDILVEELIGETSNTTQTEETT